MANNYLQFSFVVGDLGCEELREWITGLLSQVDQDERTEEFGRIFPDFADTEELGFAWDLADDGLHIYAEENGDIEAVVSFLKALLAHDASDVGSVGFTYAVWCSKMRPDEFSGGAVVVRDNGTVKYLDAYSWLSRELEYRY